jgi:hypothetical protein
MTTITSGPPMEGLHLEECIHDLQPQRDQP